MLHVLKNELCFWVGDYFNKLPHFCATRVQWIQRDQNFLSPPSQYFSTLFIILVIDLNILVDGPGY